MVSDVLFLSLYSRAKLLTLITKSWSDFLGFIRAVFLIVVFPIILFALRPRPKPAIQLPTSPSETETPSFELIPDSSSVAARFEPKPLRVPSFDLSAARGLMATSFIILLAQLLLPSVFRSPSIILFGLLTTGLSPLIYSLFLEVYTSKGGTEVGKLFGILPLITTTGGFVIIGIPLGILKSFKYQVASQMLILGYAFVCAVCFLLLLLVELPSSPNELRAAGASEESFSELEILNEATGSSELPRSGPGLPTQLEDERNSHSSPVAQDRNT
ncbi:hypothetical protein GYMLUDRAFT_70202 [Collybiopsis luxurians FD-317 M1]|nr:hypothetical protein GYMLUDRAFT_70202 [Collybiopsis luxurians FD-317 M1]